jgi:dTDP-glucose pyrophosphorylase
VKDWERTLVGPGTTLRQALAAIDVMGRHIVLVVDDSRTLLGTLTDGDVRRALLRGAELTDRVDTAMHQSPTTARAADAPASILATMRRLGLHQIPVVDEARVVRGLAVIDDFLTVPVRDNWVVIMAGGMGSRLEELTKDVPKPMLKVGSRPILETIVRSIALQGFRRFYLATNYKAEQIEAHFGDGRAFGVEVQYLRERERLGTAGALSLLPEAPTAPMVVLNGDILSTADFSHMVDAHIADGADATMAVRDYEMQVPFGVVQSKDGIVEGIEEKPIQRFVVSAGMYVLSPSAAPLVPRGTYFDMPSLFGAMREAGMRMRSHSIDGYWLDIGRRADYERANADFPKIFG